MSCLRRAAVIFCSSRRRSLPARSASPVARPDHPERPPSRSSPHRQPLAPPTRTADSFRPFRVLGPSIRLPSCWLVVDGQIPRPITTSGYSPPAPLAISTVARTAPHRASCMQAVKRTRDPCGHATPGCLTRRPPSSRTNAAGDATCPHPRMHSSINRASSAGASRRAPRACFNRSQRMPLATTRELRLFILEPPFGDRLAATTALLTARHAPAAGRGATSGLIAGSRPLPR